MTQEHSLPGDPKPHTVVQEQNGELTAHETASTPDEQPIWSVESALRSFNLPVLTSPPATPIAFFHLITRLKLTPREGWRRFGIFDVAPKNSRLLASYRGESISDHMYRMSIMTMLAPRTATSNLDIPRCTRMALIHDMAESLVGDITPVDNVPKNEKSRREAATIDYIAEKLLGACPNGGREAGRELKEVWWEYENGKTAESVFVHDVDKIELLLQMVEYESDPKFEWVKERGDEGSVEKKRLDLGEFSWTAEKVVGKGTRAWAADVLRERVQLWEGRGESATMLEDNRKFIAAVDEEQNA